jgi:hypothetical protein
MFYTKLIKNFFIFSTKSLNKIAGKDILPPIFYLSLLV